MIRKLIVTVKEHRFLGLILAAYLAVKKSDTEYYEIEYHVKSNEIDLYKYSFSEKEIQLIKRIEKFDEGKILKIFVKNKSIRYLKKEFVQTRIRPYIERHIYKSLNLLAEIKTPLFFKSRSFNRFYPSDSITVFPETAETVFNFTRTEHGTEYFLSIRHQKHDINLNNKAGIILVAKPCILILENQLYFFEDIDGKKLSPFFVRKFVHVPRAVEYKYYNTFIKNSIKNYQVKNKGFDINFIKLDTKINLFLEKDAFYDLVLSLKFQYGSYQILANKRDKFFVDLKLQDTYTFSVIKRDVSWEKKMIGELKKLGLNFFNGSYFLFPSTNSSRYSQLQQGITWINENNQKLKELGVNLIQRENLQKYFLGNVDYKFEETLENDWFDLKIEVHFGKYRIPFIDIFENIKNGVPFFTLPDGQTVVIPEEWFTKFQNLVLWGKRVGKKIRLHKMHFKARPASFLKKKPHELENFDLLYNKNMAIENPPPNLQANLRAYQKKGYSWLCALEKNKFGACLADDMGLGKTLQTIALLLKTHTEKVKFAEKEVSRPSQLTLFDFSEPIENNGKTSLIVMPTSLIHNWELEFLKFAPSLKIYKQVGGNRSKNIHFLQRQQIILTTYVIVRNDLDLLKQLKINYLVLDESQSIKNPLSKIFRAILLLTAQHKLALSGTPIENSLMDLWAQMNFLNKGLLGDIKFFKNYFLIPIEKQQNEQRQKQLQALVQPFILRRTKHEVVKDLPELTEQIVYCSMTEAQKKIYENEKSKVRNWLLEARNDKSKKGFSFVILQALMRLRQIANHPNLFDKSYTEGAGKFDEIARNIESVVSENHRLLIFSSFVKHLAIFEAFLNSKKISYSILTGASRNREQIIREFQEEEKKKVFLISLKAGGVGLNLTAADYVFILDPWWNPAAENQAISRAHRIGQNKPVFVYKYITKDTVEKKILELQRKKQALAETFIHDKNPIQSFSMKEITMLFQ